MVVSKKYGLYPAYLCIPSKGGFVKSQLLEVNYCTILDITLQMYGMIHLCKLADTMTKQDLLILMTASICHDLDHPGYNNT